MRFEPLLCLTVAALAFGCSGTTESSADSEATGGVSSTGGAASGGSGGSGGSSGGSSSGGGSAYQCVGEDSEFATLDKSCADASDCVLARHANSCCGDGLHMAINASETQRFATVESSCAAQIPVCGCYAAWDLAEDGIRVPFDKASLIVAECIDGVCNSRYGGATFECADRICTENDYCTISTGGPVGSVPSGTCVFDDGCNDCACASTPVGCECSAQDGNVTISCALP